MSPVLIIYWYVAVGLLAGMMVLTLGMRGQLDDHPRGFFIKDELQRLSAPGRILFVIAAASVWPSLLPKLLWW